MKILWCWRCKAEVPMLDEAEFAPIARLHADALKSIKNLRETGGMALSEIPRPEMMSAVSQAYASLTGVVAADPDEIVHHRISLYGPPCIACQKPLRTPDASFCAACGERRTSAEVEGSRR